MNIVMRCPAVGNPLVVLDIVCLSMLGQLIIVHGGYVTRSL